jgi:hypothetical protein
VWQPSVSSGKSRQGVNPSTFRVHWDIGDSGDKWFVHCEIAIRETPIGEKQLSAIGETEKSTVAQEPVVSWMGVKAHREIGDSVVKSFGVFRLAKPGTPIRNKTGVTSQRSHGAELIAGANT